MSGATKPTKFTEARGASAFIGFGTSIGNDAIWEGALTDSMTFREIGFPPPQADCLMLRETDEFLLLREMNHRLANTLTVLASVLRREFDRSVSPELRDSLARCEARIIAFSNLHRFLVIGAANDWVSVQSYIERLCQALSEALLKPLGIRCEVFADTGQLPSNCCERLGLVITELVTNAAKHAFHGRDDGLVRVELVNKIDSWVCIVSDNGVGTTMAPLGIGSKILKQLVVLWAARSLESRHAATHRLLSPAKFSPTLVCRRQSEDVSAKDYR